MKPFCEIFSEKRADSVRIIGIGTIAMMMRRLS
jgi:hypothetical protein